MKGSVPTAVISARHPESDEALRRYLDARRARETQIALADEFAGEYTRALEGAKSQERQAAAVLIAETHEEACSLIQIELDLMVAAKFIPPTPRNVKWTFKIPSRVMKCSVSLGIMFKLLRTGAMSQRLRKQFICRKPGPTYGEPIAISRGGRPQTGLHPPRHR